MPAFAHPSNTKLNAAGLTPDHSLVLPERAPQPDEVEILNALTQLYASQPAESSSMAFFAPNVVFTMPTGDVTVGIQGMQNKFESNRSSVGTTKRRQVHQRLLTTPEALPPRTMCIDQIVVEEGQSSETGVRSLLVLKRRAADGLITNLTEEEGHRRATAPLAARAAAASNFHSPTDNMLSPCTSKLNLAKKKHHLKGKPTTLFASQLAATAAKNNSNANSVEMEM